MEINHHKYSENEEKNILESGLKNLQIIMKNSFQKSNLFQHIPQTTAITIKKYRENDTDIDSLLNRMKEIKHYKNRIKEKIVTNQMKKYNYKELIQKFSNIHKKLNKKNKNNLLNESDYTDDSIDYNVISIKADKNHEDERLKHLRKYIKNKDLNSDLKLSQILKNDIEIILRNMDNFSIEY